MVSRRTAAQVPKFEADQRDPLRATASHRQPARQRQQDEHSERGRQRAGRVGGRQVREGDGDRGVDGRHGEQATHAEPLREAEQQGQSGAVQMTAAKGAPGEREAFERCGRQDGAQPEDDERRAHGRRPPGVLARAGQVADVEPEEDVAGGNTRARDCHPPAVHVAHRVEGGAEATGEGGRHVQRPSSGGYREANLEPPTARRGRRRGREEQPFLGHGAVGGEHVTLVTRWAHGANPCTRRPSGDGTPRRAPYRSLGQVGVRGPVGLPLFLGKRALSQSAPHGPDLLVCPQGSTPVQ